MFFFGSKKPISQNHLVISVEGSHVRACFVLHSGEQKPYITGQNIQTFQNEGDTLQSIRKALSTTLESLMQKYPTKVDSVSCVFSSPWYVSYMDTYIRDEEAPFVFRERDVKKILKNTVQDFENQHKDKGNFELLEKNILHIGINGYEVHDFKKEHTRRAEVSTYVSLVQKELLRSVEDTISRYVKKDISFHTSMLVQSVVSRDTFQYLDNFVLVSIEGSHSEVSIINNGSLVHGDVISSGENLVSQKAVQNNIHPNIILSELAILNKGTLHTEASTHLKRTVSNVQEEWRRHFVNSLVEVTRNIPLPEHCVVIAKPTAFFWIKNALEDSRNKHLSVSDKNLHAILMNAEALHSFVGSKILEPDFKLMIYAAFTTLKVQ